MSDRTVGQKEEDGPVSVDPMRPVDPALSRLLDQMSAETFHDEIDVGKPVGKEVW